MLAGFLGKLSSEAVRGLARNLFPGFYELGISANKALEQLKGAGLGYRRTDFLKDYREGFVAWGKSTYVSKIPEGNVPKEDSLSSQYHGTPDRYSFVFKATGVDAKTGDDRERYFFYHRNSLDTKANMEADAGEWAGEQGGSYGFEIEDVSLIEGYVNPAWQPEL